MKDPAKSPCFKSGMRNGLRWVMADGKAYHPVRTKFPASGNISTDPREIAAINPMHHLRLFRPTQ
jgi:hypothetical protein